MPGSGENPYSAMLRLFQGVAREAAPPAWETASVVGVNPVRLMFRGVEIDGSTVLGADLLKKAKVGDEIPLLAGANGESYVPLAPGDMYESGPHGHKWEDIEDAPGSFPPGAHTHAWGDVTEKPVAFPPAEHGHAWDDISSKPETFSPSEHSHAWGDVTEKPETFPPAVHNHDDAYLGINAKAADSDRLDGLDSTAFASSEHGHSDLMPLSGGTFTGNVVFNKISATIYSSGNLAWVTDAWIVCSSGVTGVPSSHWYWVNTIKDIPHKGRRSKHCLKLL